MEGANATLDLPRRYVRSKSPSRSDKTRQTTIPTVTVMVVIMAMGTAMAMGNGDGEVNEKFGMCGRKARQSRILGLDFPQQTIPAYSKLHTRLVIYVNSAAVLTPVPPATAPCMYFPKPTSAPFVVTCVETVRLIRILSCSLAMVSTNDARTAARKIYAHTIAGVREKGVDPINYYLILRIRIARQARHKPLLQDIPT